MKTRLQTEFRIACVCAGFAALVSGAQAKTLAWYRFDEAAPGEKPTAGEATILNAVDSTLFPATAWTEAKDGSPSTDARWLATYADAFPSGAKVFDPLSGTLLDNARCLEFKANGTVWGDFYGTFLTVADDERLRVPSVTVELFARFDGAADLPLERTLLVYPNDNGNVYRLCVHASGHPLLQVSYLKDGKVTSDRNYYGDRTIKDGKWHHLAFVVRSDAAATAYEVSLYQDYRLVKAEWLGGPRPTGRRARPSPSGIRSVRAGARGRGSLTRCAFRTSRSRPNSSCARTRAGRTAIPRPSCTCRSAECRSSAAIRLTRPSC